METTLFYNQNLNSKLVPIYHHCFCCLLASCTCDVHHLLFWYKLNYNQPLYLTLISLRFKKSATNAVYVEEVNPHSKINLVCPNFATLIKSQNFNPVKEQLYENIWLVSKTSYEKCSVDPNNNIDKRLLMCDSPSSLKYYSIVFQQFSAQPSISPTFKRGQTYYLICK